MIARVRRNGRAHCCILYDAECRVADTIVQTQKSTAMMLMAERSAMPVTMPGSAIGSMNSNESSRGQKSARAIPPPPHRCRAQAQARWLRPRPSAKAPARPRFRTVPDDAEPLQRSPAAETEALPSVLKAYRKMTSYGRCRNKTPPIAANPREPGAASDRDQSASKAPTAFGDHEIDAHDDDGDYGEGRGERDVACGALLDEETA